MNLDGIFSVHSIFDALNPKLIHLTQSEIGSSDESMFHFGHEIENNKFMITKIQTKKIGCEHPSQNDLMCRVNV